MKKIFISQPMRDKTDEQIEAERNRAIENAKEVLGEEVEVIQSFFKEAPHDATPLWFLGESIKLLGQADIVYFCKSWEKYRGCCIERECCIRYGIDYMDE